MWQERKELERYIRLTVWERMTGKAHKNKLFLAWFPKTFCIYFTSLCFQNYLFQLHLQIASASNIANSTNVTDIVSWIEKIHCTGISMPGEKVVGGALVSELGYKRIQLKDHLLPQPWLQLMFHLRKGLICICRCQSKCKVKAKAKPA